MIKNSAPSLIKFIENLLTESDKIQQLTEKKFSDHVYLKLPKIEKFHCKYSAVESDQVQ